MDYLSDWCTSKNRLEGKTVVVTGCNTGIGKETVADFYTRGARIIMACRDLNKANAAKADIERKQGEAHGRGELVVEKLDLSNFTSVREFVTKLLATEPVIDILVNNAGVMMCPEGRTEDGFETQIASNHLGHALLTLLLLPRLLKSEAARIIFVSSVLHTKYPIDLEDWNFEKSPYNAAVAYCRSKSANILFSKALANELKKRSISNVKTYSLHPGVIRTEIGRHFHSTLWRGATWFFDYVMGLFLKSARCGAQTTIYCAVDDACAEESGLYYYECAVGMPSIQCQDEELAAKLWDWTIKALNLNNYNAFE